jgi:hypothetical protein
VDSPLVAPARWRSPVIGGADAGATGGFALRLEAAKNGENETPGFAKRNERFREAGHKPLKSLGREMSDFAISFVFKALSPLSFRAVSRARAGPRSRAGGDGGRNRLLSPSAIMNMDF